MKRKLFAALLAAAMLMSVMTGCGNTGEGSGSSGGSGTGGSSSDNSSAESAYTKPTGDVDLQVWYAVSGVTGETFEAQVKAYQEANPNIHIELSYAGSYADAAEKISANRNCSRRGPDCGRPALYRRPRGLHHGEPD